MDIMASGEGHGKTMLGRVTGLFRRPCEEDEDSASDAGWPYAVQLAEVEAGCVAAAKAGVAPLERAACLLSQRGEPLLLDSQEHIDEAEEVLQNLMEQHGLQRRRRSPVVVDGAQFDAWTYFEPAEAGLFRAIDGPHPMVLAVTAEPRRFMKAVIDRRANHEPARPVFVWTSASGLFEVERRTFWTEFHSVSNSERVMKDREIQWFDLVALRASEDIAGLRRAEALKEASLFQMTGKSDASTKTIWVLPLGPDGMIHVAVDQDGGDEWGGQPLSESDLEGLAPAVKKAAERHHAVMNEMMAEELKTLDLSAVVTHILEKGERSGIYLLADAHAYLSPELHDIQRAGHVRVLQDAYHRLQRSGRGMKIVMFAADIDFPENLREEVNRIDLPLPSTAEREVALREKIGALDLRESIMPGESTQGLDRLVESSNGMTLNEVRKVMEDAARSGSRDPEMFRLAVRDARKHAVSRNSVLEMVDLRDVAPQAAGLDLLVQWLDSRKRVFQNPEAARRAGIDRRPRGILLLGMPGSGKSLLAKVVANEWDLPLLRLDMGAVQNKYVGESEARIRRALKTVSAMAPCVLWIDELDKAVAQGDGTHSHSADLNIRATLLNWMQEYKEPVFVVATANRIGHIPPELMRAGRFDARFFLGCPGDAGREKILDLHLKRRAIDPRKLDMPALVKGTFGFTGAEMEQLVLDSLYDCFAEAGHGQPGMDHFLARLEKTKPLIKAVGAKDEQGRPGQLDEVWAMIDQGRVELASSDCLNQAQVAGLIDPYLYRPVYCRKESVSGFESLQSKAERLSMGAPHGGAVAAVLDAGDGWVFVYTNFRFDRSDVGDFKFLDKISTLENNGVFDTLVIQYGMEQIIFKEEKIRKRFEDSETLGQFVEMFADANF
jgi:hypothetical protein